MTTPDLTAIYAAADKAGIARSRTDVPGSENLLCASDAQLVRFAAALAQAPAGMATVPVTPTDDMLIAGQEAWMCTNAHRPAVEDCEQATAVWAAMVAAAA